MNLKTIKNKMQRKKIEKIVESTGQLLPAYKYAHKKNALDVFYGFIEDNKLEETFFEDSYHSMGELDSVKERESFTKFVENKGIEYITKVYGNKLGKKLKTAQKNNKIDYLDIFYLSTLDKKDDVRRQGKIIEELLELYNDDLVIGIHRTGGWENAGKTINETGLNLSGHLSSGILSKDYYDVMKELEKNVDFSKRLGLLIVEIATGGSYKNIADKRFVDISIIAIPPKELQKDLQHQDIIQKGTDGCMVLNPKYVNGYVTVDNEYKTLENYVRNPRTIQKQKYTLNESVMQKDNMPPINNMQKSGREGADGEER